MGQQLIGRPVSQRFDPTFQSAGFNTLTTASNPFAPQQPQQMPLQAARVPAVPVSNLVSAGTYTQAPTTLGFLGSALPAYGFRGPVMTARTF